MVDLEADYHAVWADLGIEVPTDLGKMVLFPATDHDSEGAFVMSRLPAAQARRISVQAMNAPTIVIEFNQPYTPGESN